MSECGHPPHTIYKTLLQDTAQRKIQMYTNIQIQILVTQDRAGKYKCIQIQVQNTNTCDTGQTQHRRANAQKRYKSPPNGQPINLAAACCTTGPLRLHICHANLHRDHAQLHARPVPPIPVGRARQQLSVSCPEPSTAPRSKSVLDIHAHTFTYSVNGGRFA
jgi:hypothetical protein